MILVHTTWTRTFFLEFPTSADRDRILLRRKFNSGDKLRARCSVLVTPDILSHITDCFRSRKAHPIEPPVPSPDHPEVTAPNPEFILCFIFLCNITPHHRLRHGFLKTDNRPSSPLTSSLLSPLQPKSNSRAYGSPPPRLPMSPRLQRAEDRVKSRMFFKSEPQESYLSAMRRKTTDDALSDMGMLPGMDFTFASGFGLSGIDARKLIVSF